MIVVDTSVWIGHMRNAQSGAVQQLRQLANPETILIGDIVLLELLQGARDERHAKFIDQEMDSYKKVSMFDFAISHQAARNHRTLRGLGVTPRKTSDLIIGTFCIENDLPLLHDDRDFDPMVRHLGLELA